MSRSANRERVTDRDVREALDGSYGVMCVAAQKLGISSRTLQRRIDNNPRLAFARDDAEASLSDVAIGMMIERVRGGDVSAARWWLDHFGRSQGFVVQAGLAEVPPEPVFTQLQKELLALFEGPDNHSAAGPAHA